MLVISNKEQAIISTNHWGSDLDRAGTLVLSPNAGAFRLLVPVALSREAEDMASAKEVVVTRGRYQGMDAIEILFDDGTDEPYAVHLGINQCIPVPAKEDSGKKYVFSVWVLGPAQTPVCAFSRTAWYRIVSRLPYMKPWTER